MLGSPLAQLLLAATFLLASVSAQEVACYAPDGKTLADNETYVPCNKLGITQQGVFSSCCNLDGKPENRDLCTTTGLCLNKGVLFRAYCTDKTWESDACVKVCMDDKDGGSPNGTVEITPCTDGKSCCGGNNLNCCGTPRAFELPTLVNIKKGNVTQTSIVTETAIPAESSTFKNTTIGLGAALGAVVLIAAVALFILYRKNKALAHQLDQAHQAPAPAAAAAAAAPPMEQTTHHRQHFDRDEIDPYQDFGGGSTITSASVYGGHNKTLSSIPPSSPGPSEAPTHMRFSELDATSTSKNEAPS